MLVEPANLKLLGVSALRKGKKKDGKISIKDALPREAFITTVYGK